MRQGDGLCSGRAVGRLVMLALVGVLALPLVAATQDIAGIEDCTKTAGLDRRTGCLQANVNYLQRTLTRNALEAHRRLQAAEAEIAALKSALAALRLQLDQLQSARAAEDRKAEGKKVEGDKKVNGDKKADGRK